MVQEVSFPTDAFSFPIISASVSLSIHMEEREKQQFVIPIILMQFFRAYYFLFDLDICILGKTLEDPIHPQNHHILF